MTHLKHPCMVKLVTALETGDEMASEKAYLQDAKKNDMRDMFAYPVVRRTESREARPRLTLFPCWIGWSGPSSRLRAKCIL